MPLKSRKRAPMEGVTNIVRFNWPFFVVALTLLFVCLLVGLVANGWIAKFAFLAAGGGGLGVIIPLVVSYYVYDQSALYDLPFLRGPSDLKTVVNLTAGFNEISNRLRELFPQARIGTFDFYHDQEHTEASIRRARSRYPVDVPTEKINTAHLPLKDQEADLVLAFLSLHEVRKPAERVAFLSEIKRVAGGEIVVVEHLRDWRNFLAYSLGFLHFHSESTWRDAFAAAGFFDIKAERYTPFLRVFTLNAHP